MFIEWIESDPIRRVPSIIAVITIAIVIVHLPLDYVNLFFFVLNTLPIHTHIYSPCNVSRFRVLYFAVYFFSLKTCFLFFSLLLLLLLCFFFLILDLCVHRVRFPWCFSMCDHLKRNTLVCVTNLSKDDYSSFSIVI